MTSTSSPTATFPRAEVEPCPGAPRDRVGAAEAARQRTPTEPFSLHAATPDELTARAAHCAREVEVAQAAIEGGCPDFFGRCGERDYWRRHMVEALLERGRRAEFVAAVESKRGLE